MRGALTVVAALGLLVASAAPAAPPEYPVSFIKVDELKRTLDRGAKADIIDVRHWEQFAESHEIAVRDGLARAADQGAPTLAEGLHQLVEE